MADKKISQLSSASTPLAGTEVLPIVQGGSTVKVSVDNLTAGKTVSALAFNSSAGYQFRGADDTSYEALRVVGGSNNPGLFISAVEATKKVRLNATGSLAAGHELCLGAEGTQDVLKVGVSNVTLSTGNLVVGTAAKGIDFSANTGLPGETSSLLDWYEEGTWTPNQGPGLTVVGDFTSSGTYTRIGRMITVTGNLGASTSVACSAGAVICTNLPITAAFVAAGSIGVGEVNQSASCIIFQTQCYAGSAISATVNITFTASYFV
jgi:hypothetical protein